MSENKIQKRKSDYLQFIKDLTTSSYQCQRSDECILRGIEKGLLPNPIKIHTFSTRDFTDIREFKKYMKERFNKDDCFHSDYFFTTFFDIAPDLLFLSKEQLEGRVEQLKNTKNPYRCDDNANQWRVYNKLHVMTIRWFLGYNEEEIDQF